MILLSITAILIINVKIYVDIQKYALLSTVICLYGCNRKRWNAYILLHSTHKNIATCQVTPPDKDIHKFSTYCTFVQWSPPQKKRQQFTHIPLFGKHQKKVKWYLIAQRITQILSYVTKIVTLVCVFKNTSCRGPWKTWLTLKYRGQEYYCRVSWNALTA